jgi:transposase
MVDREKEASMAYRYGNRGQMTFLPKSIEEYVAQDDPVRAYDAFVEALEFDELGIEIDPSKVGNSQYDPKAMLKLFVYGYSYGFKSSRKLELQTHHNLSFIWLMGGLTPDHKTIAEFRRKNKEAIARVLKQCARMCIKLGLIAGNILFVDGTRIRANASVSKTHDQAWYEKEVKRVEQRIEDLLNECETIDHHEEHLGSFASMDKELANANNLKDKLEELVSEFKETDRKKINHTDPDCANMSSRQGKHAGYNVQSVADDKNGLIVHAEAVNDVTDKHQFARQIQQAHETLGKPSQAACADAGYADTDELAKIDVKGTKVIVPSQRQALHAGAAPFCKQAFEYDKDRDCYYCPEGHRLRLSQIYKKTGNKYYTITDRKICYNCRHWGVCTTSKFGRRLVRLHNEQIKERLEAQYEAAESQKIYQRRKARVEHPFGHIKKNLKTDAFVIRGRDGVQAETSLLATCFNLARMITILGVKGLIGQLANIMTAPTKA